MEQLTMNGTYLTTGCKQPVFLCDRNAQTDVFVESGTAQIMLEQTFDPVRQIQRSRAVWEVFDRAVIGDYAARFIGQPTAIRVRVVNMADNQQPITIKVVQTR